MWPLRISYWTVFTFSCKESPLRLLSGLSESPASLFFCFGAAIKWNTGYLTTSPTILQEIWRWRLLGDWDRKCVQGGDTGQKDDSRPSWEGADGMRFHHAAQNSVQFKTYERLTSEMFHLIFLNQGRPWVTQTAESETADEGRMTGSFKYLPHLGDTSMFISVHDHPPRPNDSTPRSTTNSNEHVCSLKGRFS